MSPETLKIRREPYSPNEINKTCIPMLEEMRVFEESGAFNALDKAIGQLAASYTDVLPVNPYYKSSGEGQKVIAMGVRWNFKGEKGKIGSPTTRQCNDIEITANLDDNRIAIRSGHVDTVFLQEQWEEYPGDISSYIKFVAECPGCHVWTETGEKG